MAVEVLPVDGGDRWEVRMMGMRQRTYARKKDARDEAERLAKRRSMTLRIRRGDGTYQTHKYKTTFD